MNQPNCPHCALSDQTYKLSLLYLQASERLNNASSGDQPELDALLSHLLPPASDAQSQKKLLMQLVQAIRPPASGKSAARRVHPDMFVGVFAILAFSLLYQIANNQPEGLPFAIGLLAASLVAYLIARKTLVARYLQYQQRLQDDRQQIERAISEWMRFYFCARDQGVFDPTSRRWAPYEQISDLYTVNQAV